MTSWCAENAVESKLEACLERIRVSRMWWIFDGLQKGSCTIKVVHDGDRIDFVPTKARKVKAETIITECTTAPEPEGPEPATPDIAEETPMEEKPVAIELDTQKLTELDGVKPTADVTSKLKPKRRGK